MDLKALTEMQHDTAAPLFFLNLPRTKFNYKRDVGTGIGSSSIMGPVQWIQRAFSEAPLVIKRQKADSLEEIKGHPLIELIKKPNPFYSGIELFWASIFSWATSGNVFWLLEKVGSTGKPVRLWWIPSWIIDVKFPQDGSEFLSGYEYKPGGKRISLDIEDVLHIRHGIDPNNPRLGISPLHSVMREVWTDDEASNFVAALLRNSGVPGIVVSPSDSDSSPQIGDVDAMKQYFKEMFTGDRRGEPIVMSGPTKVQQFGFSPQKLDLSGVRNTTEERVCVNLGIPAAVVGFGTGMQQTKVGATLTELRKLAWINGIIPLQNMFANEIKRSLLPFFESNPEQFELAFDRTNITALQEDLSAIYTRNNSAVTAGWMLVSEARERAGLNVEDRHKIFLRPASSFETPDNSLLRDPQLRLVSAMLDRALGVGNGKGNGHWIKAPEDADIMEERVIENAPRRKPRRQDVNLIRNLEALERKLSDQFAKELVKSFNELGKIVAEIASEKLKSLDIETKDAARDSELITSLVEFGVVREGLRVKYATQFELVVRSTFNQANISLGLATNLPDPVAIRILEQGGSRVGLIDLSKQTRERLFQTLAAAREQGLGPDAIARRIRNDIPAGRYNDVKTRARVIARTETKFAQNQSMLEYTKESGAERAMVFDARSGDTDETCEALNGAIVSLAWAEALVGEEHPNGTRSFTPWFEEI